MLIHGDCLEKLKDLDDNSVDSIVTDPPYGLSFMGKKWDYDVPSKEVWTECLRVLKPGGYLLSFAGTRTQHRMAVNIEDAGFEIRDMIAWVYGQGFPKSTRINLSPKFCQCALAGRSDGNTSPLQPQGDHNNKELVAPDDGLALSSADRLKNEDVDSRDDYQLGRGSGDGQLQETLSHDQEPSPLREYAQEHNHSSLPDDGQVSESLHNPSLAQYSGHPSNQDSSRHSVIYDEQQDIPSDHKLPSGSFYKADHKQRNLDNSYTNYINGFPVCQKCGKPNADGFGSALKPALEPITVARKPLSEKSLAENVLKWGTGGINIDGSRVETKDNLNGGAYSENKIEDGEWGTMHKFTGKEYQQPQGRFPANLIHDGSDEVVSLFPDSKAGKNKEEKGTGGIWNKGTNLPIGPEYGDNGSAARFFYCAKASKADRDEGLGGFEIKRPDTRTSTGMGSFEEKGVQPGKNFHPTVKPTKLMQYLVKLVTPKGGVVLDPFMGSGSTGKACKLEGFAFIGIEKEEEYIKIAEARINAINTLL